MSLTALMYFLSELEIVIINAKIMFWTHLTIFLVIENCCRQFVVVGYFKHVYVYHLFVHWVHLIRRS